MHMPDAGSFTSMPTPEARSAQRQQTMFVVGRIASASGESVCLVRNISATGIGVEHDGSLIANVPATIETRCMLPTRAVVRWATATHGGLEFLEPPRMLPRADGVASRDGRVLRSPRFALDCDVELSVGTTVLAARTSDIALGGLKLVDLDLAVGLRPVPARVLLPASGQSFSGRIRWNRAASAGFQFAMPLSSRELSAFVVRGESPGS